MHPRLVFVRGSNFGVLRKTAPCVNLVLTIIFFLCFGGLLIGLFTWLTKMVSPQTTVTWKK